MSYNNIIHIKIIVVTWERINIPEMIRQVSLLKTWPTEQQLQDPPEERRITRLFLLGRLVMSEAIVEVLYDSSENKKKSFNRTKKLESLIGKA